MRPTPAQAPRSEAIRVLRTALAREREFAKARAAEALLRNGLGDGVREAFLAESASAPPKYRIVTWRVLWQAAATAEERERLARQVQEAALDEAGPDRVHAVETWAKLALPERPAGLLAAAELPQLRPYARWALVASGGAEDEAALAALLGADDQLSRMVSAYALMFMAKIRPASLAALRAADASNRWVLAAIHAHGDAGETSRLLIELLGGGTVEDRRLAATAFARRPDPAALPALVAALAHEDTDVRVFAAEAVLKATAA